MNTLETLLFCGAFASYGIFVVLLLIEQITSNATAKYYLLLCGVCFGGLGVLGIVAGYLVSVFSGHVEPLPFL